MELLAPRTPPPAPTAGTSPGLRRPLLAAAVWSLAQAALALRWLLDPDSWPWADGGGLFGTLGPRAGAALV
ncbi:hypothetical protein, partial [Kineococcus glutinatus]|uniref:hypothetical protein n=1 Tax=Kineococcus glutinatus TaxID=1070872 RepID=UPI003CD087C9